VSWPSNRVLLSDHDLSRVAAVLLLLSWPWLFVSMMMLYSGNHRDRTRKPGLMLSPEDMWSPELRPPRMREWPAWTRAGLVAGAVVAVAVVAGGVAQGAAKGSARVLPGPRDQVSTLGLNQAAWTTVTSGQFQLWQARFVREDGLFMFFGLLALLAVTGLFSLRRRVARASGPSRPALQPSGMPVQ
jgi:hypothetical protein